MTNKQFKKYKLYVWVANLMIILFLIGLMIAGLYNDSLYYIFLSNEFTAKYFSFFDIDTPLITPICGLLLIILWANLEVFYKDRYKHEKSTGTYNANEKKRNIAGKKTFYIFIFITLINVIVTSYLGYNLLLEKINSSLLENITIIGFIFLPINIAITIGLGISKK